MKPLKVYIGWDPNEVAAYEVAVHSLLRHASVPVSITPLRLDWLVKAGLVFFPRFQRLATGRLWDHLSRAHCATEFAITRFLTPVLAQEGPALFVDCDVVFTGDVAALFAHADERYAVQCVRHTHDAQPGIKMVDQVQYPYARKNWSSVMLFNCDHPATRALSCATIGNMRGLDLHQFAWVPDGALGALPREWNWLVGVHARPDAPGIAHFTLGGPWLPGWEPREFDNLWEEARCLATGTPL